MNLPEKQLNPFFAVTLFTLGYIAAASLFAVVQSNWEFVIYIVVMLLACLTVWRVHLSVNLSEATLWCLSIWGLAHMAGGLLTIPQSWPHLGNSPVLYNLWLIPGWLKYDQLTHAYGFAVTTWVFWQVLGAIMIRNEGHSIRPTFGVLFLIVASSCGLGALNEVIEFTTTLILENTNVGGYTNTGWDLVANLLGALVAAIWIRLRHRGEFTTTAKQ